VTRSDIEREQKRRQPKKKKKKPQLFLGFLFSLAHPLRLKRDQQKKKQKKAVGA
jgi:hypothetical protein